MKTVTIKDVALRAGVSPKTVSRVINGENYVRPEIREAVQRIVAELDYRPNAFARSLSSSRSYLLGLFIDDPVSTYASDVQLGALTRCRERSYHLVVEPVDLAQPDWKARLCSSIAELRLDGAIIAPPICDEAELVEVFRSAGVRHVLMAPSAQPAPSAAVRMDDTGAAREMTRYLIGLGHRHVGLARGPQNHSASARREAGFREAMREAGLAVDEGAVLEGDFSIRSGLEIGERLLGLPDRPSAIFACNDDMALGVLITAMKRGLAVPQELSICGFDDSASSRAAWPQITTIRQPKTEMTAAAVDLLADPEFRRGDAGDCPDILLPHTLLERGSTGPAA